MAGFSKQDDLEKTLAVGIHGTPELRPGERRRFLGFFRERVIQAVTFDQIKTKKGLAVMAEALGDRRAVELVIHQDARGAAMPLVVQARRKGLDFTIVANPNFIGEVAVALVASDAVDVGELMSDC